MIGQTIAHYKILEKLGEGGMGEVYQAEDTKLGRRVALKVLPADMAESRERLERFDREAKALAALDHPGIVTIYSVEEVDGVHFLTMGLVEGRTLDRLIPADGMPADRLLDVAVALAEAVAAAHDKGIAHRDLKPTNVMVTPEGKVVVLDFGLAKAQGRELEEGATALETLAMTQEGRVLGTLPYMSPEQAVGKPLDHRTDIFSLGTLLYEMTTGQRPFPEEDPASLVSAILTKTPEPVAVHRSKLPPRLGQIILKCLEKDRERRYQSSADMARDLRRVQQGLESGSLPNESLEVRASPDRVSGRRLARVAALIVLLAVAGSVYYFFGGRPTPPLERTPIAVADFVNETGEEELDGLSGMLITALEQSRHLSVLTRSRMFDILEQLDRTEFERIDEKLVGEIGRHAGIDLLALPAVRKFGSIYTLDLKVLDRQSNRYLLTADSKGEGQESIPGLIDDLVEQVRRSLQEREAEIEAYSPDIATVTTSDLEAYKHYFEGEERLDRLDDSGAITEFERAVALDPAFGLAWYRLGYALHLRGDNDEARVALQEALARLDRMPEKERYLARAYAAHLGHSEAELDNGLTVLREMERLYPQDKEMLFFIGDWSYHNRYYDTSRRYLEQVLAMDPTFQRGLWHFALLSRDTGRHREMLETARRYKAIEESAEACYLLGAAYARLGQLEEAKLQLERSLRLADDPLSYIELAFVHQGRGEGEAAEATARLALERYPSAPWARYALAEILLREGRASEAEKLAREYIGEGQSFHALNLLARVLVVGGLDRAEGILLAERAMANKPDRYRDRTRTRFFYPVTEYTLGLGYLERSEAARAAELLEQAAALAPLRTEIREALERAGAAAIHADGSNSR